MRGRALRAGPLCVREKRCLCGQLLAILSAAGVELKCRRCKRLASLPLAELLELLREGPICEGQGHRTASLQSPDPA